MPPFFHFQLRRSDVAAARAFYQSVLGGATFEIVQLNEQAAARGARPQWLGFLDVGDVDRAAASFARCGAIALGPKWVDSTGLEAAIMRDLESLGVFHPFSWERDGPPVGSMRDIRAHPGVHPHWPFHWRVAALEPVLEVVRAGGGVVVGPVCLPTVSGSLSAMMASSGPSVIRKGTWVIEGLWPCRMPDSSSATRGRSSTARGTAKAHRLKLRRGRKRGSSDPRRRSSREGTSRSLVGVRERWQVNCHLCE